MTTYKEKGVFIYEFWTQSYISPGLQSHIFVFKWGLMKMFHRSSFRTWGQFWRNGGRKSFRQSKAPKKPSVISNYYLSKQNPDTPSLKKTAPWTLYKPKPFSVGFGHKGAQVTPSLWDGSIGLKDHKLTEKAWAIDLKIYQYKLQKCGIVCLQSMILHLP